MNFQGGFSIPQPEEIHLESSWMPVTPQKPPILVRSNSVPENPNGNQVLGMENWIEPATNHNCLAQIFDTNPQVGRMPERFGYDGNLNINGIAGSYQQPLPYEGEDWNNMPFMQLLQQGDDSDFVTSTKRTLLRDVEVSRPKTSNFQGDCSSSGGFDSGSSFRPETANAHCQVENSWIGSKSDSLLPRQGTQYSASYLLDNGNSIPKRLPYDFPTPSRSPNYDLNSSPSINNALTNISNSHAFTPVTPEEAANREKQHSAMFTSLIVESTSQEKDRMGNLGQHTGEAIQQHGGELLQNILESSSTVISTPQKENTDSDKKIDVGIDLNKTPPQKPTKRKKHRPKVIVEGKPKRTQKPAVPKDRVSMENRPAKRKYVRKNVPKDLKAQEVNVTGETRDPGIGTTDKTCKRVLNFDLEKTGDETRNEVIGQQDVQNMNKSTSMTKDHQAMEQRNGTNHAWGTMSSEQNGLPKGLMVETQIPGKTSGTHFTSQMTPDRQAAVAPSASTKEVLMKSFYVTGRHEIIANADQWQNRRADNYTPMQQQTHREGTGQESLQGKANNVNLERARQIMRLERIKELMMQIMPQQAPKTPSKFSEARGSKREHCQTTGYTNLSTPNQMGLPLYENILHVEECHRNGHPLHPGFLQTPKKQKIGNDSRDIQNMPSNVKAAYWGLGKEKAHDANPIGQKSRLNSAILNSHLESGRVPVRGNNQVNFTSDRYVQPMASAQISPKQQILSKMHSHTERIASTRGLNPLNGFSTQTTIENYNHLIRITSPPETSTGPGNGQIFQTHYNSVSQMVQTVGGPLLTLALSGAEKLQEPSAKRRGSRKKQASTLIDEIIYRLQSLNLNGSGSGLQKQDQNALVLYKRDGAVVPFDGMEFLKKRKPRPKVDLDPETNRIWNLLMGKEGGEEPEGTDKEKEKWWEEERKVFSGRVDSFIARMHLVQGDRRFSPWKGSVVDSVIGVFLTQNVSDHLSSSAFMSLAARFPLKSSYDTQDKAATNIIDRQAPISILNPDDTIKWREVSSAPINHNITAHESSENQWGRDIRGTERSSTEARSQSLDEEFILSQDSFDSTITQVAGGIRSCSGSNSETEDPCTSFKPSNVQLSSLTQYLHMEKTTSVQDVCGHVNGSTVLNEKSKHGLVDYNQLKSRSDAMKHLDFLSSAYSSNPDYPYMQPAGPSRVPDAWFSETFSDESTSSWHSTASRSAKGPEAVSKNSRAGELAGSFGNSTKELNGECRSQEAPAVDPYPSLSTCLANQQGIPQPAPNIGYNHQSSCSSSQHERNNMFHWEGTSSTEPVKLDKAHRKMQNASMENVEKFNKLTKKTFETGDSISTVSVQIQEENRLAESNLKEHTSNHASDTANTKNSKAKRGNTDSQKKNDVNWDNLRKQVESNGRKRERGKGSLDSLDYEAVRNASVNEISNTIKERGMNNMLAERMKAFLNRLVEEHGSIDLEWLRDVPPDKAKDYLLSIRGLGLKSVECVRLLTLHHLAFPVDTNVGRIAVRLGWVPLQPLPESLQLHLLELYPMLESIQKYLWPRLCKLDQRTLYELHYQMITFGKVFCTKSKPNCNACPMRGECRHFASAFASARLALPGPEEKGIVSSTVPLPTKEPPAVVIHPMTLPLPENDSVKVGYKTGNCEPIIEEPATPEQECTEISQSDIEDAFYEDPDEIPTIKLNMDEFTENLQSYMQKNMELQECDMSKALVALTPNAASIPIPKLKNVSRLRTEHQVYELPDSHPLLERLDRREPDDPSPYLLAIWTPGETANSIQPSERSCGSQEPGKFCNDEACFSCNSTREANSQTVRGTLLIPCRTAMRGSFPLNGTYFQVNEVFADHESSLNPIDVPRNWLWNLPRRMVYFGTSVTTIFKGLSTEGIQFCFWKGFVCVRGFDMATRAPRPLMARLHFPASKLNKARNDNKR